MAFARPRINLVHASEAQQATKQAAFAATWEPQGIAATTVADGLADAIGTALETDVALMRDTAAELARRYRLAACSNGNISLMADIAARNGWRWDAILGADIAHDFKPKRGVYLAAADAFDLKPSQCMMVAAHNDDLNFGAAKVGLHTAFIARPLEHGAAKGPEKLTGKVDIQANSLIELADKLGA